MRISDWSSDVFSSDLACESMFLALELGKSCLAESHKHLRGRRAPQQRSNSYEESAGRINYQSNHFAYPKVAAAQLSLRFPEKLLRGGFIRFLELFHMFAGLGFLRSGFLASSVASPLSCLCFCLRCLLGDPQAPEPFHDVQT